MGPVLFGHPSARHGLSVRSETSCASRYTNAPVRPVATVLPGCMLCFQHQQKWEALALSPGMWVRLRRLTIKKNRQTGNMSAKMMDKGSSINPLHPRMAEVQHVATSYATHCASANGGGNARTCSGGSESSRNGSGISRAPVPHGRPPPRQPAAAAAAEPRARQTSPPRGACASRNGDGGGGSGVSKPFGREKIVTKGECSERESDLPGVAPGRDNAGGATSWSRGTPGSSLATIGWQRHPPTSPSAAAADVPQPAVPRSERGGGSTRGEIAAPAGGAVASSVGVGVNSRGLAKSGGVSGCGSDESVRGTKRALPLSEEGGEEASAPGGGRFSNLGVVRSKTAPSVFDIRARIVSHWPSNVRRGL